MPRPKYLLGKVATFDSLQKAWIHISEHANKDSHGMSDQTIESFRSSLGSNIKEIRKQLLGGTYEFGKQRAATIDKEDGKKRPLRINDIRDRVVQRAMTKVLEDILEDTYKLYNPVSFAYLRKLSKRPPKGVQTAIKQMLTYHQENCEYVFEADIVKFFDTVPVDSLLDKMIYAKLPDQTIDNMIREVFEMEIGNRNDLSIEERDLYPEGSVGLPQGGYLSPLFANIYLSEFDQAMIKARFRLIRYADDFIVMCKSRAEAEKAFQLAKKILEGKLGLELHQRDDTNKKSKTRIMKIGKNSKLSFLGVQFDGLRIKPDHEKKVELSNKLSKISRKSKNVQELLVSTKNLLEGWIAAYSYTDITGDLVSIDREVNKMLWSTLYNFGWILRPKFLADKQRLNSGVNLTSEHLNKIRGTFNEKDRELLTKYWTS